MLLLLTFAILIALIVLGLYLLRDFAYDAWGFGISSFSIVTFIVLVLFTIITYFSSVDFYARYKAIEATINTARNTGIENIERFALQQNIIELNKELASYQYWNSTSFCDWMITDNIHNLPLLK